MDIELALRLKLIRQQQGLSQRQLAKRAGIANATVSQIESGSLNPTVGMLKRVLDGIPMTLGEFFSEVMTQDDQIFFTADQLTQISEGSVSYAQVGSPKGRAIQLLKESYQPGATTGKHAIEHEGEECGIILSGQLRVTVGDRRAVLGPGDAYYFKSDQPHQFENVGDVDCELISACTPPSF